MPIDFQAVLNSEKARDSIEEMWYDILQDEAKHVLGLGWSGGMCSGDHLVVEWNEMYFSLATRTVARKVRSTLWTMCYL